MATEHLTTALHVSRDAGCNAALSSHWAYKREKRSRTMLETFVPLQIKTSGASIHVMKAGSGEPLLLLHGYPQTHVMWHKIAHRLAESFTVVLADVRGHGDSSKPKEEPDHANYSKRAMAQDMIEVMSQLGYESFHVVGHDRGARVTHRMLLDHGQRIKK